MQKRTALKIAILTTLYSRPWDPSQIVPRDRVSSAETFEGVLKAMKAVLYVFLIIGVWLCAIASQGTLLMLTSALIKVTDIFGTTVSILSKQLLKHKG